MLVLGDSYTFGWYLDENDTYVALLGSYSDRDLGEGEFEFLNGGAGGWGTADYLAFLEEWGPQIEPAVVVVFLNFDDLNRSLKSGLYTLKDDDPLELEAHRLPVSRLKQFMNAFPGYQFLLEHSHLVQLVRYVFAPRSLPRPPMAQSESEDSREDAIRLARALFRRIHQWCQEHEARLLVVTTGGQAWWPERMSGPEAAFFALAPEIFRLEGIPYEDISPRIAASGPRDEFVIPDDYHPNESGSSLIARNAWIWLKPQLRELR